MPYQIGENEFSKKSEITEQCRKILNVTPDGDVVDYNNSKFLFDLFKYHDEWEEKSEGGVNYISTQTTEHGTRCFVLIKKDGGKVDISFPHSIKHIPTNRTANLIPQALLDFKSAARTSIKQQIYEFRDKALNSITICPYTGENINRDNCAVDHIPPDTFDKILFDFCKENLINPLAIEIKSRDGVVAEFGDIMLKLKWEKYHQKNSRLRVISKSGNLQLKKVHVQWPELIS